MRDLTIISLFLFLLAVKQGLEPGQELLKFSTKTVCRVVYGDSDSCGGSVITQTLIRVTTRYEGTEEEERRRRQEIAPPVPLVIDKPLAVIPEIPEVELSDSELEKLKKKGLTPEEEKIEEDQATINQDIEFGGFRL